MKLILAGPYPAGTKEKFETLLNGIEIIETKSQREYDELTEGDLIIVRILKTPEATLANKKELKAIIRWGAGYDSVDIAAAGKRKILVATMPGVNSYAVSELAVALMISVGRKIVENNEKTHAGIWDNKIFADRMVSLNHKQVGIIGGGNIGRKVAGQVQAFGARTVYFDPYRLSEAMEQEYRMEYLPLNELLASSDVVTLHVPLLESTRHMIGKKELAGMKNGAIIINTARGGLIDDKALEEAVRSGKIAGAGLDCVENEALEENPLAKMEQVIITPHMGGTTSDLGEEMVPRIVEQILQYMAKGTLDHVVNQDYISE